MQTRALLDISAKSVFLFLTPRPNLLPGIMWITSITFYDTASREVLIKCNLQGSKYSRTSTIKTNLQHFGKKENLRNIGIQALSMLPRIIFTIYSGYVPFYADDVLNATALSLVECWNSTHILKIQSHALVVVSWRVCMIILCEKILARGCFDPRSIEDNFFMKRTLNHLSYSWKLFVLSESGHILVNQ